jgi:hypothetical protein
MAANPSDNFPDAPLDADIAVDDPPLFNRKNTVLRQRSTAGFGLASTWTPAGPVFRTIEGDPGLLVVQFTDQTSIQSFYLGYIYTGTPTGPFPQGLTQGSQVYIQNLNEFFLPGKWPSIGDPAMGFPNGSFTDPATQVTLTLITVDHPATGACT